MELVYGRLDVTHDPQDDDLILEWERFIEQGSVTVSARHVAFLDERYRPLETC